MNERELLQEFTKRAKAIQLHVDFLFSGSLQARLAIVGEGPGDRECAMKMPMVGGAGKLLWDALRSHGIERTSCFVTNVIKHRITTSLKEADRIPIPPNELSHWEGLLDWELDHLPNLEVILVLGSTALKAVTGDTGILKWRGSVLDCQVGLAKRRVKVIASYNPAAAIWKPDWEPIFRFDMMKLGRVMGGTYTPHVIATRINPTPGEALDYIDRLRDEKKPISFDIETIAQETACIGYANDAHNSICINFRDRTSSMYPVQDEITIRKAINDLHRDTTVRFVTQNGNFDCYWLWYKDRIKTHAVWFDTLLAHHTLYPRLPHNLGFLTAQYTDHPFYKDEKDNWREGGNIDQFWEYNGKDACITWAVHAALMKELTSQKMDKFFFEHVMRLLPHLTEMTVLGVRGDMELKAKLDEEIRVEIDNLAAEFYTAVEDITGDPAYRPNPASPQQLKGLLFDVMHLVGRGKSTNEANRKRMRTHPKTTEKAIRVLNALDKLKHETKFHSTNIKADVDSDNRFRCEYKQFGTQSAPGRLSSTKTMWGSGMNLQNQPKRAYPMFIADPGYMLTYFDLKQAEAVIVAYKWNVSGLKDNFERAKKEHGFDVHRANAARIYRCEYNDIPKKDREEDGTPTLRYLGKRCVHGLNYRMEPDKLAEVCEIPLDQAISAYNSYHRAFPEIKRAWKAIIEEAKANKMIFSCMGRRMIYLERITDEVLESVIAFDPQSTIGDKVGSVIYLCHEDPEWPRDANGRKRARIILNIHDALVALHQPRDREAVMRVMKRHAEAPIYIRGEPVSIGTDFKFSVADEMGVHRWSTLESE